MTINNIPDSRLIQQGGVWYHQYDDGLKLPVIAGGDHANELGFPFGSPEVDGTTVTVDWLLEDVSRVERAIANIMLQKFYVDRVFSPAGQITGGAVEYEQATSNDIYPDRDVQRVEPGDEFPEITFSRGDLLTAQVEKFGGKFPVHREARRRNRIGQVEKAISKVANVITRKTQQRAIAELTAAVTTHSRTEAGNSWYIQANTAKGSQKALDGVIADLTMVEEANETQELGYEYNMAIMNPTDWRLFRLACGGLDSEAKAVLADSGINEVWKTNRKTAGSVYWLSERQVGELGYEEPLATEDWEDKSKQTTWLQTSVLPIVYVTDPFAILETTGHAATS